MIEKIFLTSCLVMIVFLILSNIDESDNYWVAAIGLTVLIISSIMAFITALILIWGE